MNKKTLTFLLIIAFILTLILLNMFLNNNQYKLNTEQMTNELSQNKNEEEEKMEFLKVTSANIEEEVLKSEKPVLIDFYADWCGPCKMISPVVEAVAKENEDIKVVKVNVDDAQDLAIKYEVMSIPTLVVIKDGEEANRTIGLIDKNQILNMIK